MINPCIFSSILSTLEILSRINNFRLNVIGLYGVVLWFFEKRFRFLFRFPFRSHVQIFLYNFVVRLKSLYICFSFLFEFPSFCCCSVWSSVTNAAIGCGDYSFFALFYVVFYSMYWRVYVVLNAGEPSSSFLLDTYRLCHLSDVKPGASSLILLSSGSFVYVPPLSCKISLVFRLK